MRTKLLAGIALATSAGPLAAGGIDRSGQGVNILFEQGTVAQMQLVYVSPEVSGNLNGAPSGNVASNTLFPHFGYKQALNDQLDFALIYDQPFGAELGYSSSYPFSQNPVPGGRTGVLSSEANAHAVTGLLRYKFDNGASVIGGIRGQTFDFNTSIPPLGGYIADGDSDVDFGYVLGVAWEKPEIAARVALTYNSAIKHDIEINESFNTGPGSLASFTENSEVQTPQSVNLDFQTGVAPRTLLFGGVRWVDWPQANYRPPNYPAPGNLVEFSESTFTYKLGVGYLFSEAFSGALVVEYEQGTGEPVSDIGPGDGFWGIGLAGTYTLDKAQISGFVGYSDLNDADTLFGAQFRDNNAWSVGLQVTYTLG